jgi:hypothetical protein
MPYVFRASISRASGLIGLDDPQVTSPYLIFEVLRSAIHVRSSYAERFGADHGENNLEFVTNRFLRRMKRSRCEPRRLIPAISEHDGGETRDNHGEVNESRETIAVFGVSQKRSPNGDHYASFS